MSNSLFRVLLALCVISLKDSASFRPNTYCPSNKNGNYIFKSCENGYSWRQGRNYNNCIRQEHFCDKIVDCSDGSDEKYCSYNYNYGFKSGFSYKFIKGNCPANYYLCQQGAINYNLMNQLNITNDRCVKESWICDGIKHCSDGSDEKYCPYDFTSGFNFTFTRGDCSPGFYNCKSNNTSRQCIRQSWICDDYTDCDDGSDEYFCPYINQVQPTPPPTSKPSVWPHNDAVTDNYNNYFTDSPSRHEYTVVKAVIDPLSIANVVITSIIILVLCLLIYNLYHTVKVQNLRNQKYLTQQDEPCIEHI